MTFFSGIKNEKTDTTVSVLVIYKKFNRINEIYIFILYNSASLSTTFYTLDILQFLHVFCVTYIFLVDWQLAQNAYIRKGADSLVASQAIYLTILLWHDHLQESVKYVKSY